jgi:hypothetical protein|uniref:NTP-PPase-like protein n=1 Tax=Siphoviridae sp. ctoic9 TaxID=2825671 RepID=A0A8S5Q9Y6_9CAUD|nr:MAG TPA: NTP-PPase-like protein [Siphoviridae sp. ctoic9]
MNNETNIYNWDNIVPLALYAHQQAVAKGFWKEKHPHDHYLMLVITELAEAVEADRKLNWAVLAPATIDTLEQLDGAPYAQMFLREVKDTVEDEIADACIRLLDLIGSKATEDEELGVIDVFDQEEDKTLTQMLFRVCMTLHWDSPLSCQLKLLRAISERYEFDLMKHIELKMKYNATRPALHGKKY